MRHHGENQATRSPRTNKMSGLLRYCRNFCAHRRRWVSAQVVSRRRVRADPQHHEIHQTVERMLLAASAVHPVELAQHPPTQHLHQHRFGASAHVGFQPFPSSFGADDGAYHRIGAAAGRSVDEMDPWLFELKLRTRVHRRRRRRRRRSMCK